MLFVLLFWRFHRILFVARGNKVEIFFPLFFGNGGMLIQSIFEGTKDIQCIDIIHFRTNQTLEMRLIT